MKLALWSRLAGPFALIADRLTATLPPAVLGVTWLLPEDAAAVTGTKGRHLWLDLPEDRVLVRSLSLTSGQEAQWRDHVAERLPMLSPWKTGDYLWDAAVSGRDKTGAVSVDIVLTALADIEALEGRIGRRLAAIRLTADGDRPALWLRRDQRLGERIQAMGIGLVLGTCLFGLAVAGWQMQHALRDRQATAADQASAARMLAASDHPAGLAEAALALLDKRPPQAVRALTLARLAQRLPDATWAVGLRIDAAGFELSGISAQPEALVPLLEADPGLEQVQLSATSAREAESGLFTFTISGRASPTGEWP
jgi:Tfp pilus assembly protein PilN